MAETSVVPEEVQQFGKLAGDWWDPRGASAMLHKLNPVRLAYIRDWVDQHWALDEHSRRPLEGKSALDVGCGAGLLAEPLARLGAQVTAIDPAAELIAAAREHAAGQGLAIDYRVSAVEDLTGTFDLITSMEVIEHTATAWSRLITITLAEGIGAIPKGTHDFDKFIAPERMKQLLANAGLKCLDVEGLAFSPTRGLHLSEDVSLNYLVAATR